jgi:hypothetical protein
MGREARCACRWGHDEGLVTALLESNELVIRGAVRKRAALDALREISVHDDKLAFVVAGERIELMLGTERARRWADAIAAPRPTLAQKLGITPATRLSITGAIDDDGLRAAVATAATIAVPLKAADLALIRTDDIEVLMRWVHSAEELETIAPAWAVYVKGRRAPLGEPAVREFMRGSGFMDTKIASVSERLTALRFVKKK